jgi:hypothetical protein
VGEGDRQAQAAVVVGVLADQVDPPGRATDDRGRASGAGGEAVDHAVAEVGGAAGVEEGHGVTLGTPGQDGSPRQ